MMSLPTAAGVTVLGPFVAALLLALIPSWRLGAAINAVAATLSFAIACLLPFQSDEPPGTLLVDRLATLIVLLIAFVAMTTSWFSRSYVRLEIAAQRISRSRLRVYHVTYQLLVGSMMLAVLSNNLGLTWLGIEIATVAAAFAAALPCNRRAAMASRKTLVMGGAGGALALFGTTVLHMAAVPALGAGWSAMHWSAILSAAAECDAALLNLAFVLLLLGYSTIAALVPLHAWKPETEVEGPTPVSAILAGSMVNVGLLVILRLRDVMEGNAAAIRPGPAIMTLGLASMVLASFGLWQRRDVKRFFAFSGIQQTGMVAFAFGLGGAAATFAGLLHMMMHTLARASVLQCVGGVTQLKGGQVFGSIGGLLATDRALGLTLTAAVIALAALPPSGLFTSSFLIATATLDQAPILSLPLGLAVVVGGWALVSRLQDLCFGSPMPDRGPAAHPAALAPVWVQLGTLFALGMAMPPALTEWLGAIAGGVR